MTTQRSLGLFSLTLLACFTVSARGEDKKEEPPIVFKLQAHDPAFEKLIDKDATLEVLAKGFAWTEGPVWMPAGFVLFSDIPNNRIVKWDPETKKTSDFLKSAGYLGTRTDLMEPGTNGLTLDTEGRLVMCQHGDRQVTRLEKDGKTRTTLAAKFDGKRLNSPNDLAFKSNGDLYFTDPPYGQMRKGKPWIFPDEELGFRGVYRLNKKGELTLLTKELQFPNGIAFSPDEKTLYVAQSNPLKAIWMAFPVEDDGTLGKGKVLFDATKLVGEKNPGLPDGLKVDKDGHVFATGPGGVLVISPEGKHLGTIATGVPTANCAFGGEDGSTLYITANTTLCRIKTNTKGATKK